MTLLIEYWFICFTLEYYLLGKRNDTHLVFAYWIFCLKIDSWRVLINLFLTVKWFMLLLCRVKPKVWRFCLPKVRLSAPKSDVAELAYSSPEIFANGGSWTKNLLYFRVQLLKNLLGKILHKNQIWWHSISQMSVTVVYL